MPKKYLAEFVGTFVLCFVVIGGVSAVSPLMVTVPVMAGLVLGLFVYTIGSLSGCHINPAVTIGLLSIRKITRIEAVRYVSIQIAAAVVAILVSRFFGLLLPASDGSAFSVSIFFSEVLGASVFTFGIGSVVYNKVPEIVSGIIIGGSLTLGILISVLGGAAGILNPAVAVTINAISVTYLFAPVIGSLVGFNLYTYLMVRT